MRPATICLHATTPAPEGLRCLVLEVGSAVVAVFTFRIGDAAPERTLTTAEEQVAVGIMEGKSNEAIAKGRGTSSRTVANQIASIFRKHKVVSRAELVARYLATAAT